MRSRPIGALLMEDESGIDEKILAVPVDKLHPFYNAVTSFRDLPQILIDQIEKEKAQGRDPWDAVIEATTHRFRPILLTAAAAILGMIPIAPTIFWGPMAYAIMGGLAVATLLTLVFLPALYVTWFGVKRPHQDACQRVDTGPTELVMQ